MRKIIFMTAVAAAILFAGAGATAQEHGCGGCAGTGTCATASLKTAIAGSHKITGEDEWHGFRRIKFEFEGMTGWVVEPWVKAADGMPWTWTMQWADAFVDRTGVLDLLREGYHHVTLEAFETRCADQFLPTFAAFQKFLVDELGFAPKANLVGMSWGGFYSVRYASTYPGNVRKVYLDAPLLTFGNWGSADKSTIGIWDSCRPDGDDWTDDPRMPLNMAEKLAASGIPVLLLYGGHDQTVNPDLNCRPFIERFKAAGGKITVKERALYGHHPHGEDPDKTSTITDFFKD